MNIKINAEEFESDENGIVAAIPRKDRSDDIDFDWSVKPKKSIYIPSRLLMRLGKLSEAYDLQLISRISWTQCRLSGGKMSKLMEECAWLFDLINDPASHRALQNISDMAGFVEQHQAYPHVHWLLLEQIPAFPPALIHS